MRLTSSCPWKPLDSGLGRNDGGMIHYEIIHNSVRVHGIHSAGSDLNRYFEQVMGHQDASLEVGRCFSRPVSLCPRRNLWLSRESR